MSDDPSNHFLLGEISATTKGTAEDVKALRIEVGDMTRRLNTVEQRVEAIEAERAVIVPDYSKFVHKVNNHIQADTAWKANFEGQTKGGLSVIKVIWGIGLVALGVIGTALARYFIGV